MNGKCSRNFNLYSRCRRTRCNGNRLGGAAWWLIKYILGSIVTKISEAQAQTEADIKDLKLIIVGLIDKTTQAQGDLIRLDTLLRVRYGLDPDEKRIARNPNGKKK